MSHNVMNECYFCKHRRGIAGDAHSRCVKPDEHMKGHKHGVNQGWFQYPFNYDPVWKLRLCNNFEEKSDGADSKN